MSAGTSSIDLDAFAALVTAFEGAERELPEARSRCASDLSDVLLDTAPLRPVDRVLAFAAEALPDLRRRLALAQQIESSSPGIQSFVMLDESRMPTDSPAQAAARARQIAGLITDHETDRLLDPDVLATLRAGCSDPYFAAALASRLSPRDLADVVLAASGGLRVRRLDSSYDSEGVASYVRRYGQLLRGLGSAVGLATRGAGDLALGAGYARRWVEALTSPTAQDVGGTARERTGRLGEASALAALLAEGRFSTDFTTHLTRAVVTHEREFGEVRIWSLRASDRGGYVGAYDADGRESPDPLAGLMRAVARDPVAATVLFGSEPRTTVDVDGATTSVSWMVRYVVSSRRWSDGGAGVTEALRTAMTPGRGGPDHATAIRRDVVAVTTAFRQDIEARTKDHGPISTLGHFVLDVGGMAPLVGEPADGVNAVWYAAEGDPVNAGASAMSMMPLAGWWITSAKWGRRVVDVDDVARLGLKWRDLPIDAPRSLKRLSVGTAVGERTFFFGSEKAAAKAMAHPHPGVTYRIKFDGQPTDYVFDANGDLAVVRGPGAAARTDVPRVPAEATDTLAHVESHNGALPMYFTGNRRYDNVPREDGEARLPAFEPDGHPVTYTEWDIDPSPPGIKRNARRILGGSDGTRWYTDDHFRTLVRMR